MDIPKVSTSKTPYVILALGVLCLLIGSYIGLAVAPAERFMGDVQRIMYVHVPTAWNWMLAVLFSLWCAIAFLFRGDMKWDTRLEAGVEVGTLLAFLLCCQGAIWAKPTWGVWWDWDPRLTTTAVLLFAFLGILALRKFVEDPVKRAIWSSVATIIAAIDLPIVYMSVKWWNSLHQQQSTPSTVSSQFHLPLRLNAFGVLFLMTAFIMIRSRIAAYRLRQELAEPPVRIGEEAGELA
ncbi:MAG TPA: cytochrome c biogenesis protein CcsA [Thermoanaerobaculia bacterium]|jgi:heme exporter protein C|nr:cytochrome c biogenesis protein CcsA [Thermoanaerobaculia bacterium]